MNQLIAKLLLVLLVVFIVLVATDAQIVRGRNNNSSSKPRRRPFGGKRPTLPGTKMASTSNMMRDNHDHLEWAGLMFKRPEFAKSLARHFDIEYQDFEAALRKLKLSDRTMDELSYNVKLVRKVIVDGHCRRRLFCRLFHEVEVTRVSTSSREAITEEAYAMIRELGGYEATCAKATKHCRNKFELDRNFQNAVQKVIKRSRRAGPV